jgi:dTDP-glucose 4,6-dehydratase
VQETAAEQEVNLSADAHEVCEFAATLPLDVLHGARVWITGAGGFLGTHLVRAFLALDQAFHLRMSVVGVGRDAGRMRRRWRELGVHAPPGRLTVEVADLSRPLTRTGRPPDVIVHAASQASPRFYATDPVGTLLPNTVGTAELLSRAVAANARAFLFLSSSEVYGAAADRVPETETGSVDPVDVRNCC